MLELDTVTALIEAQEKLDAAMHVLAGLTQLPETSSMWNDTHALRGALALARESVLHAYALIHSILDKGR